MVGLDGMVWAFKFRLKVIKIQISYLDGLKKVDDLDLTNPTKILKSLNLK